MALPRKRLGLDIYPIEHEGQPVFVVRDPQGIAKGDLGLPGIVAFVWDLLDGERDVPDVQAFIAKHAGGVIVPSETIQQIVKQLDEVGLLETERVEQRRREIAEEFARAPARPARFAGLSYADGADQLAKDLEAFFTGEYGAGLPDGKSEDTSLRGVLSPHIDFNRGGPCYTHAYRRVAESKPADTYLILGVAHSSPEPPFVPTTKSYETPFGPAEVDRDFVEGLLKRTNRAGMDHELVHRTEHSAEFQAVFLRFARRDERLSIVPILCSAFERHCGQKSPSSAPLIEDTVGALQETIRESGRRVCIVAGVDFAHVGPRFGDPVEIDRKLIDWMMEGDRRSLAHVAACDAEGFWQSVMEDRNQRKVCGLSATYTALRLLSGARGELLRYTYAPDPAGGIVSFAAAAFR